MSAYLNRSLLQKLSETRRREARALMTAGHFEGAYYLVGYAVECALKACVAKQIKRYDFPDKKLASEVFTHDLEKLVRVAGLSNDLARDLSQFQAFELNWTIVKDWSEAKRYELGISRAQARDLYSACVARTHGLLPWVKRRW